MSLGDNAEKAAIATVGQLSTAETRRLHSKPLRRGILSEILGWARLTADRDAPEFWPKAFREEEEFLTLPTKHQFATDEDQVSPL